jgi:hypothetical protein
MRLFFRRNARLPQPLNPMESTLTRRIAQLRWESLVKLSADPGKKTIDVETISWNA